jgi:hypothetical protein
VARAICQECGDEVSECKCARPIFEFLVWDTGLNDDLSGGFSHVVAPSAPEAVRTWKHDDVKSYRGAFDHGGVTHRIHVFLVDEDDFVEEEDDLDLASEAERSQHRRQYSEWVHRTAHRKDVQAFDVVVRARTVVWCSVSEVAAAIGDAEGTGG